MKPIGFGCCAMILALATPILPARAQQTVVNLGQADMLVNMPGPADAAAIALTLPGAAVGVALIEQRLVDNHVEVFNLDRQSLIDQSFLDNRGIVNVNQDSGEANNQANVRVIALAMSGAAVDLRSVVATVTSGNTLDTSGGSSEDRISGSFGDSSGLLGVNQSSGSLNQQSNVMLIGLGTTVGLDAAQLGDSTLASVNGGAGNTLNEGAPRPRSDVIDGSFAGFHGAAQISQSAGDLNRIANNMAISVMPGALP